MCRKEHEERNLVIFYMVARGVIKILILKMLFDNRNYTLPLLRKFLDMPKELYTLSIEEVSYQYETL